MRVKVKDLSEGCILTEDVFRLTSRPIIQKNTVLTNELIEILNLFLVSSVRVSKTLVTGVSFLSSEVIEEEKVVADEHEGKDFTKLSHRAVKTKRKDFTKLFLQAVQEYKKQFQSWQSGSPIDILKIRSMLLPLLGEDKIKSTDIFLLHHLSNNEEYHYQHAVAVGLLSGFMARKLHYPKGEVIQVALAGVLADCG